MDNFTSFFQKIPVKFQKVVDLDQMGHFVYMLTTYAEIRKNKKSELNASYCHFEFSPARGEFRFLL